MSLLEDLQSLGLTKTQAKLYLALVEHGQATVSELHRRTKVSRSTIYDNLERLIDSALIFEERVGMRQFFSSKNPDKLSYLVDEQTQTAELVIGELSNEFLVGDKQQNIQVFTTTSAISDANLKQREYLLKNKELSLVNFGSYKCWEYYVDHPRKGSEYLEWWCRTRVKVGNITRTLNSLKDRKKFLAEKGRNFGYRKERDFRKLSELKVLPDSIHFEVDIAICKDQVHCYLPPKEQALIFIKSRSLAETFECFFDLFWERSDEIVDFWDGKR